jgi:hypothetical protein
MIINNLHQATAVSVSILHKSRDSIRPMEAAKRLGRTEVPTLTIAGLSAAEKRAVVIADNRLPEQAVWDFDLLRGHFTELIEVDFDVELTGLRPGKSTCCWTVSQGWRQTIPSMM